MANLMAPAPVAAPAAASPAPTGTANPAAGTAQSPAANPASAPPAPPAKKQQVAQAAAPSAKKKYQLKIDGQTEELEFDASNDEEVTKHLQMSRAAQKRMQQFAEYDKGVKQLFETLQKDPLKVLADPRLKIPEETRRKMAEAIINGEIEEMQKSPEQREKERLQKEYENLKQQHEQEKKARETAEFKRLQDQAAVQLDTDISAAIESAKLPKTARTVKYMAEAMMFCLQNDIDLSAKDLIPYLQKQTLNDFREIISSLPDDEFEEFLGKDQISRVRKRSLAKLKAVAATPGPKDAKPTGATSKPKEEPKKVNAKDFFKGLGRF